MKNSAPYTAIRASAGGTAPEWEGHAADDEEAAHRLAQHIKTKLDQGAAGYSHDDMVTLSRADGAMVTMVSANELIERLRGWKTSPTAGPDLEAE